MVIILICMKLLSESETQTLLIVIIVDKILRIINSSYLTTY